MKKMIILAAIAAAAALTACKPDNPDGPTPGPGPETKDEVSVSPASVAFEGEGGALRVAVTTNVADYSVSGNPDWLTVSKSGNELTLTAAANTVPEARECNLTVTAGTASAGIAVSQKAGSPYPGYVITASAELEYGGTMLYQFLKPQEEDFGGWGDLVLLDEDGNQLTIWLYTDLFKFAEEVELTAGTYTKGLDDYGALTLYARKLTYMAGTLISYEGDDEASAMGSYYTSAATEETILLTDGTVEVSKDGDAYTVKVDMKGSDGKDYKFVHLGEVTINTDGATYPSETEHIDVAATIIGAECYWNGDKYGNGTSNYSLIIYSGDLEDPALTNYEFNAPYVDFSEDIDLSGFYGTPVEPEEGEEPVDPYSAGMIIPGVLVELFPGFEMPMGTYVMYSFGDYLIGDAFDSLTLEKQGDGTYTLSGAIMSSAGDFVMFLGVEGLSIPVLDSTAEED